MDDHELIQQIKAKTFPRIRELMVSRYKESVLDAQHFFSHCLHVELDFSSEELAEEPSPEALEWLCSAPLTDLAVTLLWAVAAVVTNGIFVSSDENIAAVVASIDLEEAVRVTGMKRDDVSFVLKQMAESLVEVIREHTVIDVEIDRQPVQLKSL